MGVLDNSQESATLLDEISMITDMLETMTENMATENMGKFTSIPPFAGKAFFAWSDEDAHGGTLEPPHVHIKLQEGEVKCWLGQNKNQVTLANKTRVPAHIVGDVIKHIKNHWNVAAQDWNKYVVEKHPQFANDPKCIISLSGETNG